MHNLLESHKLTETENIGLSKSQKLDPAKPKKSPKIIRKIQLLQEFHANSRSFGFFDWLLVKWISPMDFSVYFYKAVTLWYAIVYAM